MTSCYVIVPVINYKGAVYIDKEFSAGLMNTYDHRKEGTDEKEDEKNAVRQDEKENAKKGKTVKELLK